MTKEEFIEYYKTLPTKDKIEIFSDSLITENTTYRDAHIYLNQTQTAIKSRVNEHQSDTLKPRFDLTMMYDALSYQLENKAIPVEVFQYIQDMYNKDDVWMKVAKHTKLKETDTSKVAAIVVKEDYPIVESIEEKGLSVKKAITNGKTPTQQIRNVSKYISLSDRVDSLERKVSEMEHKYDIEFSKVKEQQMIQENRLESIERDLTDYMNPKKISAIRMRMEGKLNVEIAEILDVHPKTITRWLKGVAQGISKDN